MGMSHGSHTANVGIVSNEPLRLAGLLSVFEGHPTASPRSGDVETLLRDPSIKLIVLDVSENPHWLELLQGVRRRRPEMRSILLGQLGNDELVFRAIIAGARAYLDEAAGPWTLRQAVDVVLSGSIWAPRRLLSMLIDRLLEQQSLGRSGTIDLSPREKQVLDLILQANSNREIAANLGIEERTVKSYVASLMRKAGVENRVALSVMATHEFRPDGET